MKIPEYLIENNELIDLDLFNRDTVVNNIYNYIDENENNSPIKIWLYWDWGIWKTYLLKQLQKKIRSENWLFRFLKTRRKVVFLDIKNPENFQKFRRQFFEDIKDSTWLVYDFFYEVFKCTIYLLFIMFFVAFLVRIYQNAINNKDIFSWDAARTSIFVILATAIISKIWEKIFDIVSSHNLFNDYYKSLDEFYVILFLLRKRFMWSKVIVVIDDLDRVDAKYVPEILLWLNRISTIKKGIVNIIIVADPSKLGQGIQSSFVQYSKEEWYEFLEKMVDTPYYLDKLSWSAKYLFWNTYKDQLISDFQPLEVVENFLEYLPENIRQLKRYFRFIYTLIDDLKRFWPNEVDFETLFFIQLMKLEHPNESLNFIDLIIENKILFAPWLEDLEKKSQKFKEELNKSEKRYFSYFEWRFVNWDKLLEYYYFISNVPKITENEFHSIYMLWNEWIDGLIKVFNWNLSELLLNLANYKEIYYSKLVDQKTTGLMHQYQCYVEKVYWLIELVVDNITERLLLNPRDFTVIFNGITSYMNFTTDIAGIKYKKHREIESKLIDKLLKIIHPETLFFNTSCNFTNEIDEKIKEIYWEYLINKLWENIYENKIFDHQVRYLLYKKMFLWNWIQQLLAIDLNDNLAHNYYFIIYNLLISLKNWIEPEYKEKIKEVLWSTDFKEFVSKISFATINPRSLWSFEQDVLETLSSEYKELIKFLIDRVKEFSPRWLNVQ